MTDPDLIVGDRLDPAASFVNDDALAPLLAELKAELIAATEKNEQLEDRIEELETELTEWEGATCSDCTSVGPGYDVMVNTVRQVHDLTHHDGWAVCTDPVCRVVSRFG